MAGGRGGVPPQIQKKGRAANSCHLAMSGTQNAGKPLACESEQGGSRGAEPPWQGVWGMCPQKQKIGGELPTLATPPRVGSKTLVNPKPTGVGNRGSRGAKLPWQGNVGGCPPDLTP